MLRRYRTADAPIDIERSPSTAMIRVNRHGNPTIQFLMPDGQVEPIELTRHAARQLAQRTLPARGLGFVDSLAEIRDLDRAGNRFDAGASLASVVWSLFGRQSKEALMFRTVDAGDRRIVRAVLSQGYAVYDCLEFVEDTLRSLGTEADNYRAIGWNISDSAMRLRLVAGADASEHYARREVDKPIPMVELWDSEIGARAVYVKSGTFTLWCSNGCGHWSDDAAWRWNHSGRTSTRIRDGVRDAIAEAALKSAGIVEAYDQALHTAIDDAVAWFRQSTEATLSDALQSKVIDTMGSNPTVHGAGRLLASVVDAVTYVAHEQSSLFEQERLERLGGQLLHAGLRESASAGFGRIGGTIRAGGAK